MKSVFVFCALNYITGISGYLTRKSNDNGVSQSYGLDEEDVFPEEITNGQIPECLIKLILNQNKIYIHDGENVFRKTAQQEIGDSRRENRDDSASRAKKEKYVKRMIENFESKGLSRPEILKILQELYESTRHQDLKEIYAEYIKKYQD